MTRDRHKGGPIHTTINLSADIHDWISEYMVKKGFSTRTRAIEEALRAYIATVDRDPLTQTLEHCWERCSGRSCEECPVLESCAKYLKAESLASFALEGMMDISNRQKKMKRGEE